MEWQMATWIWKGKKRTCSIEWSIQKRNKYRDVEILYFHIFLLLLAISFSVCIFLWVLWMCVGFCGIVPCKYNHEQRWKARFWFANNSTSTVLVKWSHTTLDFLLAIIWFCKMGDLESHCLSAKPPANNFILVGQEVGLALQLNLCHDSFYCFYCRLSWLIAKIEIYRNIILYLLTEVLVTARNLLDKIRLASPIFGIQEAFQHAFLCEVVSLDDILGADLVNKEAIVKQPLGRLGLWFQV